MTPPTWQDVVGLSGVALILYAYLALQLRRIKAVDPAYSALNAVGAAAILLSLVADFNLSAFVIEICWLAISLFGLAQAVRRRGSPAPPPES